MTFETVSQFYKKLTENLFSPVKYHALVNFWLITQVLNFKIACDAFIILTIPYGWPDQLVYLFGQFIAAI